MANRYFKDTVKTLESAIVKLYGSVTFGASGAVSSSSCKGFSVAKTSGKTGRYTITLEDKYNSIKGCFVSLVGPDDAAATTAAGYWTFLRNDDVASAGTFDVQFVRTDTGADADPTSGNIALLEITLKNSSNTY